MRSRMSGGRALRWPLAFRGTKCERDDFLSPRKCFRSVFGWTLGRREGFLTPDFFQLLQRRGRVVCPPMYAAPNRTLDELAAEDEALAALIEMRYFGGMTAEESADVSGKSVHVVRQWLAPGAGYDCAANSAGSNASIKAASTPTVSPRAWHRSPGRWLDLVTLSTTAEIPSEGAPRMGAEDRILSYLGSGGCFVISRSPVRSR